ncbi:MAG: pilus assembly protein CpaF [Candidatus Aquicultor secundus]|uniref:Pilus assembly protein CpaF n=1 Tax=Candidatus Aquicultor secundus TaxID=1973895 RepID=A0A2M7T845_9ACTN|nr:CpaF family protein [Candidatus Aquicultor secundus]NCO65675.1 CpaF family protein [Solirubrobacter sp.]PIU27483.1 MAG: pilus assembly protein CpaF [Candidatus Aquicultor secundus]PIW22196.1 MAG: pilus assembly protein CpaF [Candidatus Aquicultor secundus]PIX52746.1 MAG: pilus assembly protein CpaF [Candidatus Aquicultor secundus]PIY39423.1 MAG: pilus assembly protein CpaF [Candidatus Aquicultor secundus]
MSLHQRLNEARAAAEVPEVPRRQILDEINKRIHHQLIEALGPELYDRATSSDELKIKVENRLKDLISVEPTQLSPAEKKRLIDEITNDVLGYGPLDQFLRDPEVTEIMINGAETIYIERFGKIELSKEKFLDDMHLRRIIDKIVAQVGRRIDESVPMVDARLQDGSRVNAIIPPLAIGGPKLTIRKFSADPFKVEDLINFGTITPKVAMFIEACVRGRLNVIVSGGTGSGKTTTLNVLSSFIPTDERILTIEDAVELQLRQDHVIQLESRPANIEGKGEVAIRDLVRNALRMRPDRIVVGEVRGGEALDMLQAMNTGHDGSLSTVHANAPRDVLSRLETMVLMSGMELPIKAIREQCSSAIDLIIQQARLRDGTRRITHITEVQGMEGDIITLQDLFLFDFSMGLDESGKFKGKLKSTGIRPKFTQRLQDQGISLPAEVFQFEYIGRGMAS